MNSETSQYNPSASTSNSTGMAGSASSAVDRAAGSTSSAVNKAASSTSSAVDKAASSATSTVNKVAQTAHGAIDALEQRLGSSGERVMSMQREYSEMAREQVHANPLGALATAFVAGFIIAKII